MRPVGGERGSNRSPFGNALVLSKGDCKLSFRPFSPCAGTCRPRWASCGRLVNSTWVLPIQLRLLSVTIFNNSTDKLNLSGGNNFKIRMCGEAPRFSHALSY